VFGMGTGVSS